MAQPANLVSLPSQGGLNTASPATYLQPDELRVADNLYYGQSGERRKRAGTAVYTATATMFVGTSSASVSALHDHWRYGASLVPTQRFLATSTGGIFSHTGSTAPWATVSATWGSTGGLTTNIISAQGFSVLSNGADAPVKWDQTTLSLVSSSSGLPTFTAATYHLRRLFAIGTAANPSRVDISAGGDITTWTGADTGNFVLDEDDGDATVGISKTFHKRIYIFKGPQFGSIHELAGNTLGALTRDRVFNGLALQNHKGLVTANNDIYWISRFGIHSLQTTQKYGDTEAAFLSLPIQDLWNKSLLNLSLLGQSVGFWHPQLNIVGWLVAPAGQTANQWALIFHYLISDPASRGKKFWSLWKFNGLQPGTSMVGLTPAAMVNGSAPRLYLGGTGDGLVYAGDQTVLTDAQGSAYTATARTGILLNLGQGMDALSEKQFLSVAIFFEPVGAYTHNLDVTIDNRVQSQTITMAGFGDTLG